MICYLVTAEHAYTMQTFLASQGRALAGRIRIVTYESLFAGETLPEKNAAYVFSDLDRLSPGALDVMGKLHAHLVSVAGAARVLNDPLRSLQRFQLLRALQARGINRFQVFRPAPDSRPARFPVFIREESGYESGQLLLIANQTEYQAALGILAARGVPPERMVAVEFCDTADASGLYRKYGAFVVGERIIPRHLFFSRNWMVKDAELCEPGMLAEEKAYVEANPHAAQLAAAARIARIGYGRIDYSLLGDRPQIWEINTNPLPFNFAEPVPGRDPVHAIFAAAFTAAIERIDPSP